MQRKGNRILCCVLMFLSSILLFTELVGAPLPSRGLKVTRSQKHRSTVCVYFSTEHPDTFKIGNGLLVNSHGYVLTTKHLVQGTTGILTVKCCCGETVCEDYDAEFVDSSSISDLALLKVRGFPFWEEKCPPCIFADDNTIISEGIEVELNPYKCTGYKVKPYSPKGNILSLSEETMRIGLDVAVQEGASGSPVTILGCNAVIGMVNECESVIEADVITRDEMRWVIFVPPPRIRVHMVARAVPLGQIKAFLKEKGVQYAEDHCEPLGPAPYGANPHPKNHSGEHHGMLNLLLSSIEDVFVKYKQFENRFESDILLETYFEALSFKNKLMKDKYEKSTARQNAEFFFIKGLAIKASRPRGAEVSIEYFHRALREDSTFMDPFYQIAVYHMRCKNGKERISNILTKGLKNDPENSELLRTQGMYYLTRGNYDSARVYLKKASEYLNQDDPRIPYYIGLSFDPYWRLIDPVQVWIDSFINKKGRNPTFPEIQDHREKLLLEIPNLKENISTAFAFFDSSRNLVPGYVRPLNSLVWIQANEVLRGESNYVHLLRDNLQQMEDFVEYGMFDPRFFNTLALGYVALRDCKSAHYYLNKSNETIESILIAPKYKRDLVLENKRVEQICELLTTEPGYNVSMKNPDFPK